MPNDTTTSTFPRTWDWAEGELYGHYVETRQITTNDGSTAVLVEFKLVDTGEPVTVWLSPQVLRRKFKEELRRRIQTGKDDFEPGERFRVARGEKRESASGNSYWDFTVFEPEFAVKQSAKDILVDGDEEPSDASDSGDDDIPF